MSAFTCWKCGAFIPREAFLALPLAERGERVGCPDQLACIERRLTQIEQGLGRMLDAMPSLAQMDRVVQACDQVIEAMLGEQKSAAQAIARLAEDLRSLVQGAEG